MELNENNKVYKFMKGKGVMNFPNQLTLLRMLMIPLFVILFYINFTGHYFVALAVFALAALTDYFDGMLARKYKLVTNLGKFLDPIADKVLVAVAFIIMLASPVLSQHSFGHWVTVFSGCAVSVILAREIIVSGFRMVAADAGIVIAADKIGKYKTFCQDIAIVLMLCGAGLNELAINTTVLAVFDYASIIVFVLATILTILSGANYIIKNINVLKV